MRDEKEERKKEASKVKQTNKAKATQHTQGSHFSYIHVYTCARHAHTQAIYSVQCISCRYLCFIALASTFSFISLHLVRTSSLLWEMLCCRVWSPDTAGSSSTCNSSAAREGEGRGGGLGKSEKGRKLHLVYDACQHYMYSHASSTYMYMYVMHSLAALE